MLELGDADNVVSLRRDVLVWANQQHIVIPDDLIELGEAEPDWGYYRGVDALPLEEGLFLLVRIGRGEHKVIRRSSSGGFVSPERMAAYRMYRDWAHASILAGGLRAQSIPQKSSRGDSVSYWITVPDLIAWAEAKGIPAPDELRLATTPSSQTALTHQAGEPRRGVHWEEKRAAVLEVALYRLANDLDGSCRDKSGRVVASRLAALVDEHRLFDGLARETPTVRTIAEHIRRALREPGSPELGEKKTD